MANAELNGSNDSNDSNDKLKGFDDALEECVRGEIEEALKYLEKFEKERKTPAGADTGKAGADSSGVGVGHSPSSSDEGVAMSSIDNARCVADAALGEVA